MFVKNSFMAEDENGDGVFIGPGDSVSEIEDAGPVHGTMQARNADGSYSTVTDLHKCDGWNVSFRFTPSHKLWTEIATVNAVVLLKALE